MGRKSSASGMTNVYEDFMKGAIFSMMNEYRPQEHFESYQQGYQPVNNLAELPYNTQASQPINGRESSSNSGQVYQPINNELAGSSYSQQGLFSTPLPHNDARFVAVLTYLLGWFSGLLFTLFARENRYVRFHALQSLLFFGGINVLDVALFLVGVRLHHFEPFIGPLFPLIFLLSFFLLNAIAFVGWLVAIVQAYRGVYYKLPLVGDIAEQSFKAQPPLK
jgi:uncharacterized membrane protein